MDLDRAENAGGDEQFTRCIILGPPGRELGRDVSAVLQQRRWEPVAVNHPYLAMAELCLEERVQASRAAWGLQRARGLTLLLITTRNNGSDSPDRLVRAVQKYLPATAIWRYADGAVSKVEPPAVVEKPPDHQRRPPPECAGDGTDIFEAAEVTSEEIEMLLSRDGEEERHLS